MKTLANGVADYGRAPTDLTPVRLQLPLGYYVFTTVTALLLVISVVGLVMCASTLWGISDSLRAQQHYLAQQEAKRLTHDKLMADLRQHSIQQGAAIVAQEERIKLLSAETLKALERAQARAGNP